MSKNWIRLVWLAIFGGALVLTASAKFLEDAPVPGTPPAKDAPADMAPPPGGPPPDRPPMNGQRQRAGQPNAAPTNQQALQRLLEIQRSLDELEARRNELVEKIEQLKNESAKGSKPQTQKLDNQIREMTAQLHETIEKRQELNGQKMRLYMRGAPGAEEFETMLNGEVAALETSAPDDPGSPRRDRLRLLKIIQGEVKYLRENPEAFERIRQSAPAGNIPMAGVHGFQAGAPDNINMEGAPGRFPRGQGLRAGSLTPPNPQAVAQRLDRLERELNFLRNQSERIEREITFLREWVDSQGPPASTAPEPPIQEMKETVE